LNKFFEKKRRCGTIGNNGIVARKKYLSNNFLVIWEARFISK